MDKRSRGMLVVVVLCVAALGPFAGVLNAFALGEGDSPVMPQVTPIGPPLVRLTGTFCTPGEQAGKEGLRFLNLHVGKKELLFKLDKAQSLTGNRSGDEILEDLSGNELFLRGTDKMLGPLEAPDMIGKPIYLEGNLFVNDRILEVTATGTAPAKAK